MYENVPVSRNSAVTENTGITIHTAMRVALEPDVMHGFLSGLSKCSLSLCVILTSLMHSITASAAAMQA